MLIELGAVVPVAPVDNVVGVPNTPVVVSRGYVATLPVAESVT